MKAAKLEIRLINYFLLITFAAMLIGVEFFFEINQTTGHPNNPDNEALINLRNKIVIMFAVLTLVVAIVMTMFIKNITKPLCNIADVAKRINEGDLSQIVRVDTHDEISQVGNAINELTSNFQEVATYTSSTVKIALEQIDHLLDEMQSGRQPDIERVRNVRQVVFSLCEFVDTLKLLQPDNSN